MLWRAMDCCRLPIASERQFFTATDQHMVELLKEYDCSAILQAVFVYFFT
jgi:hypothetical protein